MDASEFNQNKQQQQAKLKYDFKSIQIFDKYCPFLRRSYAPLAVTKYTFLLWILLPEWLENTGPSG